MKSCPGPRAVQEEGLGEPRDFNSSAPTIFFYFILIAKSEIRFNVFLTAL